MYVDKYSIMDLALTDPDKLEGAMFLHNGDVVRLCDIGRTEGSRREDDDEDEDSSEDHDQMSVEVVRASLYKYNRLTRSFRFSSHVIGHALERIVNSPIPRRMFLSTIVGTHVYRLRRRPGYNSFIHSGSVQRLYPYFSLDRGEVEWHNGDCSDEDVADAMLGGPIEQPEVIRQGLTTSLLYDALAPSVDGFTILSTHRHGVSATRLVTRDPSFKAVVAILAKRVGSSNKWSICELPGVTNDARLAKEVEEWLASYKLLAVTSES